MSSAEQYTKINFGADLSGFLQARRSTYDPINSIEALNLNHKKTPFFLDLLISLREGIMPIK